MLQLDPYSRKIYQTEMASELIVLDLFSGIGGFSLGLHWAGMRTAAFCETDPFCRAVLARHWPEIPVYDDVRTLSATALARDGIRPGLICGGFPCQDASLAGRGAGLDGARTGLWREMARLVGECRPGWVVAENVPGLRSRGADRVLADLEALGYRSWPLVVGAVHAGAPHRRRRLWIVAQDAAADAARARLEVRQPGAALPTPGLPAERPRRWPAPPRLRRVDHGFPLRVDRVRALGNAVVPANAAMIGRAIQSLRASQ
jgi:DNA (cytosine-5)-methyltransferase 1